MSSSSLALKALESRDVSTGTPSCRDVAVIDPPSIAKSRCACMRVPRIRADSRRFHVALLESILRRVPHGQHHNRLVDDREHRPVRRSRPESEVQLAERIREITVLECLRTPIRLIGQTRNRGRMPAYQRSDCSTDRSRAHQAAKSSSSRAACSDTATA